MDRTPGKRQRDGATTTSPAAPEAEKETDERDAHATSASVKGTPKRRKPRHKKGKRNMQQQSPSAISDGSAIATDTDLANKSDVIVSPRSGHDPKCPEVDSAQDSVVGKKCNKDNNSQSFSSLHETSAERKRRKRRERRKRRKNNTNRSAVQTPLQPSAGEVGLATTTDVDNTPGSECKKSKKRWKKNRTGVTEAPLVQRMDLGETASVGMMDGEVQSAFSEEAIKSSNNVGSSICASEEVAASSVSLTLVQDVACNTEAKADCQHAMSDRSDVLLNLGHAHKEKIQDIYSPRGSVIRFQRKKLLILDINGLLADINQDHHNAHMSHGKVRGKLVFKRPYYYDFLRFCFQNFELGIWSSRLKANVESVVNIIMKDLKQYLLFCWDLSKCTGTRCKTLENENKPLVLKELKKLWNKEDPDLPWEQGEFSPSNTLLVDDSPYKALANPPYTAIFPQPYSYHNKKDDSLGPGGDLRVYLENLATADDVQCYVREHPFGQPSITKSDQHWNFYVKILDKLEKPFA
ncbi:hypothetical protein ABZP36_001628 [Zizania latifolia]